MECRKWPLDLEYFTTLISKLRCGTAGDDLKPLVESREQRSLVSRTGSCNFVSHHPISHSEAGGSQTKKGLVVHFRKNGAGTRSRAPNLLITGILNVACPLLPAITRLSRVEKVKGSSLWMICLALFDFG
jgi:hypothetical protein